MPTVPYIFLLLASFSPIFPPDTHAALSHKPTLSPSFGVCHLSTIPVRCRPSHRSELGSELLFGEGYELLDAQDDWLKIQCLWDRHIGWIHAAQYASTPLSRDQLLQCRAFALEVAQPAASKQHYLPILLGSSLRHFDGINCRLNQQRYTYSGQAIVPSEVTPTPTLAIRIARKYLYAPYRWGGRSPFGIDAPGLTQMIFKAMGIPIPRSAALQARRGRLIDFIHEAQMGDVAFFEDERGQVIHTGLILPDAQIIHAAGLVRIDSLDHYGIYNHDTGRYTHKLRVIRRLL